MDLPPLQLTPATVSDSSLFRERERGLGMTERDRMVTKLVLARLWRQGRKLEDVSSEEANRLIAEAKADLQFSHDVGQERRPQA